MKFETKTKSIKFGMEFSHGIRRALLAALLLIYFLSLGFDIIAITSLFAISTLIMTFFEFPTSAIADYDSRKRSILISFFLLSLALFGFFLFRNFWALAGCVILHDIAWTFNTGASSAWAIDALGYTKKKSRLVALSTKGYAFEKAGHVVGGLIGLAVVAISFRLIWLVISIIYMGLFFIVLKYAEERNFRPEKIPQSYLKKSLIKAGESFKYIFHKDNRDLRIILWTEVLLVIGFSGFYIGMPLLFTEILGLNPKHLAGLYSLIAFFAIGGPIAANKFASKNKFGTSLFSTLIASSIALVGLAISRSILFAAIAFAIVKIGEAAFDAIIEAARHHEFSSKIRASLGSVSSIIWAISNSIGVFLAGLGINFIGIVNTMLIGGVILFVTSFAYLYMKI
jgi:MFS family permease